MPSETGWWITGALMILAVFAIAVIWCAYEVAKMRALLESKEIQVILARGVSAKFNPKATVEHFQAKMKEHAPGTMVYKAYRDRLVQMGALVD